MKNTYNKSYLDVDIFGDNDYVPIRASGSRCAICTKNEHGQIWQRDKKTYHRLFYRNPDGKGELCGLCIQKYTTMKCVEDNRS